MKKYLQIKDHAEPVRLMALAEGWVMVRHTKGAMPFVVFADKIEAWVVAKSFSEAKKYIQNLPHIKSKNE